jgi:Family of unknown function (DUF5761)
MSYALFREDDTHDAHDTFQSEALKSNIDKTAVSNLFFSSQNVNALQDAIRYQVWVRSGKKHVIDRQSDTELKVVMRGTYLEHARNAPYDIPGQVRELNQRVAGYCVDNILSAINLYVYYREDIQSQPRLMPMPVSMSLAGSKTLEMKEF